METNSNIKDPVPELDVITKMYDEIIAKMEDISKEKNPSFPKINKRVARRATVFAKMSKKEAIRSITNVE